LEDRGVNVTMLKLILSKQIVRVKAKFIRFRICLVAGSYKPGT
jgi:hypothetical protein